MLIVRATLLGSGPESGAAATARTVEDILWVHSAPEHGLEHVRARSAPTGIGVLIFLRADGPDDALAKANSLLMRALAAPALGRYTAALHLF
ncbi:hypothetical protein GCM10009760_56450 [Kitasatospora kazusensis]|uniref:Divalent-cation tolerance protein CutA n=1 Tax=Kitasatospora kazusensis TaxID=407974 RepID=A0ABP5M346_9ACTN